MCASSSAQRSFRALRSPRCRRCSRSEAVLVFRRGTSPSTLPDRAARPCARACQAAGPSLARAETRRGPGACASRSGAGRVLRSLGSLRRFLALRRRIARSAELHRAVAFVLVSSTSISPHLPTLSSGPRSARAGVTRRAIHTIAPFSSPWVIRSTFHPISPARNASRSGSVHRGGGHRDLWLHEAMPRKRAGARWMRGVSVSSSRPIVSPILLVRTDSVLSTITSDDACKPIWADGSSRSGSRGRAGAAVEVIAVPPAPRTYARRPQSRDGAACQRPPPRVQSVSTPRWESRRSADCGVAEACTPEPSNRSPVGCSRAGRHGRR